MSSDDHLLRAFESHDPAGIRKALDAGASKSVRLKGLIWGMGFEWETTVF